MSELRHTHARSEDAVGSCGACAVLGRFAKRERRRWHRDLPDAYRDEGVLAFLATMIAWRDGDPVPPMPAGVTAETLPGLLSRLQEPRVRRAVLTELSVLVPHPDRQLSKRGKGHGKGQAAR